MAVPVAIALQTNFTNPVLGELLVLLSAGLQRLFGLLLVTGYNSSWLKALSEELCHWTLLWKSHRSVVERLLQKMLLFLCLRCLGTKHEENVAGQDLLGLLRSQALCFNISGFSACK